MGRKAGPNAQKIKQIRAVLRKHPRGIWAREIARQAGLSKSTVHRYLTEFMRDDVGEVVVISRLVKLLKLKR